MQTHNRKIKRQQMITYFGGKIKEHSNIPGHSDRKTYYENLKKQTQELPDKYIDVNYTNLQTHLENRGEGDKLDVAIPRDELFK